MTLNNILFDITCQGGYSHLLSVSHVNGSYDHQAATVVGGVVGLHLREMGKDATVKRTNDQDARG